MRARNILISALGINEYHSVAHYKTSKTMWDLLKTLYEGTEDVKQSKNLKVKKDFENCKEEYASLVNKHITIPPNKSSKVDLPKTPKPKDIGKCEACPKLHEEIVSLKSKMEQASIVSIAFAKRSKSVYLHRKRSFKRKFEKKNHNIKGHGH